MPRTVIVTGSSSGIGAASAKRFYKDGFNVVFNSRKMADLKTLTQDMDQTRILCVAGDVSQKSDVETLISKTVETFGGLDVLVNNAGVGVVGGIADLSEEDWNKVIGINVGGVYHCSKLALPHLMESAKKHGDAALINVTSVSGIGGDWGMAGYNASKGAVSNMTRAMALDLGKHHIRVNAVAPSLTDTDMTGGIMSNENAMKKFRDRMPMGRAAEPEEVASVIAFLAGEDARFVTGVILPVDGGITASNGQPNFTG